MSSLSIRPHALGPARVVRLRATTVGLRAIVVVDNLARGPAIGGLRMAPDVTLRECLRLARAMTLKNAAADLPHGGAKAVIAADPRMPAGSKESLLRAFARAIRHETDYIVGPDMGTDEICMGWIHDEIGRAVGRHAARFLVERGAVVVAVADSHGALVNPGGLDVAALEREKADGGAVSDHSGGMACPRDALLDVDCDIWIPAARPDAIREADVPRLRAKMVLPGANIPMSAGAERALAARGVLVVPDFIANAGG